MADRLGEVIGAGAGVQVVGLKELVRELKGTGSKIPKELAKAHRTIAREVVTEARKFAIATGPMQAKWATSIIPSATPTSASVSVRPKANAAFWGTKKKTGWNDGWFKGEKRPRSGDVNNNPEWVGNSWEVGAEGGPYAINPAIRHDLPQIEERLSEAIDAVFKQAFPE